MHPEPYRETPRERLLRDRGRCQVRTLGQGLLAQPGAEAQSAQLFAERHRGFNHIPSAGRPASRGPAAHRLYQARPKHRP
jgi:hypothetical protein